MAARWAVSETPWRREKKCKKVFSGTRAPLAIVVMQRGFFLYLPQSPCPLLLIDVDEVPHHTALDQMSLSLHSDLQRQTETRDGHNAQNPKKKNQRRILTFQQSTHGRYAGYIWKSKPVRFCRNSGNVVCPRFQEISRVCLTWPRLQEQQLVKWGGKTPKVTI